MPETRRLRPTPSQSPGAQPLSFSFVSRYLRFPEEQGILAIPVSSVRLLLPSSHGRQEVSSLTGAWLARSVERVGLGLGGVSSSPMMSVEIP